MELDLLVDISNILIRGCFNTLHSRRYACVSVGRECSFSLSNSFFIFLFAVPTTNKRSGSGRECLHNRKRRTMDV